MPKMSDPEKSYVSIAQIGNCRLCGRQEDLRYGVCFDCADFVSGELIGPGKHRLWDSRNPSNTWLAIEGGH